MNEKLKKLGIDVLDYYYKIFAGEMGYPFVNFVSLDRQSNKTWFDINIQPDRPIEIDSPRVRGHLGWDPKKIKEKFDICPHYQLLGLVADILLIKPEELTTFKNFCGILSQPIMVSNPHGRHTEEGGVEEEPICCCWIFARILVDIIGIINVPCPKSLGMLILNSNSLTEEQIRKTREFFGQHELYQSKKSLMEKLRATVPHFTKLVDYPEDHDIIDRLKLILSQLEDQASGTDNSFCNPVCTLTPRRERKQWLHID